MCICEPNNGAFKRKDTKNIVAFLDPLSICFKNEFFWYVKVVSLPDNNPSYFKRYGINRGNSVNSVTS